MPRSSPFRICASVSAAGILLALAVGCQTSGGSGSYREHPGTNGNGNLVIGPTYTKAPDLTDQGNPKGKQFEFSMRLPDSRTFKGDDKTLEPWKKAVRTERRIFVYIPAAYRDGTKAAVLVTHDGPDQLGLVRNALDNLTISKDPQRR